MALLRNDFLNPHFPKQARSTPFLNHKPLQREALHCLF